MKTNSDLDRYHGKPQSAVAVANRYVDLSRQTGRTTAMIDALPRDGRAIVVVHRMVMAEDIKRHLRDRYEKYPIKRLVFVTQEELAKGRGRIRGLRYPVFVDNCVIDLLSIRYVEELNRLLNPENPEGRTKEEDEAFYEEVSWVAKEFK